MRQSSLLILAAILAALFLSITPLAAQPPDAPQGTPSYAQARVLFDQAATDYENAVANGALFTVLSQKYHALCSSTNGIYWHCFTRAGAARVTYHSNEYQVFLAVTAYGYEASGSHTTGLGGYGSGVLTVAQLQGAYLTGLRAKHAAINAMP